jgi:iron complex outermembrane receptor protein
MNPIRLAVKSALGLAIIAPSTMVLAQDAKPEAETIEQIVVTGIRASVEQSLDAKRAAESVQEIITAEDIGKMPDKNVADSLSRVTGVNTSSASANEGGFDENDRVSMRGTNASLTQTLLNGHAVAAGDWFILNQVEAAGRSVSYTLLPSELVSKVVVHKSSEASLVEGGVTGSINIVTRRPLDFKDTFTLSASAGAVYAKLPDKTDPQLSALFGWKNSSDNFGVLVQAFSQTRNLRRDGVEILGYNVMPTSISDTRPDLVGVVYPNLLGAAFFQQERKREGGLVDVQFKPSDSLEFDLQYFTSKLEASNYNRNFMFWGGNVVGGGLAPNPGYVVRNGTLVSATFTDPMGPNPVNFGIYDQISRPDESSKTNYASLDTTFRLSDALKLNAQLGTSRGHGETPTQDVSETTPGSGGGASYTLNGLSKGPDFSLGTSTTNTPFPGGTPVGFGWIFGVQNLDVEDKEDWGAIDGEFTMDSGAWSALKFGVRANKHERGSFGAVAQGPLGPGQSPTAYPTDFTNYPSDFTTFGGNIPTDAWYWTPAQLHAYNSPTNVNRDPVGRLYPNYQFNVEEKNSSAFVQMDFKGEHFSGNFGVRYVQTKEDVDVSVPTIGSDPDAINGSAFGPFKLVNVQHTYNDILPSANLKWTISDDLQARFAVSKTMTRADYTALGGFTNLAPPAVVGGIGGGSGGNPDLEPIRSTNFDTGIEWYFMKNSLLAANIFYMDLDNYVSFGTARKTYFTYSATFPNGAPVDYDLTVPINSEGRVKGYELSYQQAIGENFGVAANYTYADGKQTSDLPASGDDRMVGTSKDTYNLSAFFENSKINARVTYTYRSAFFSGLDRNSAFSQDAIDSVAASLGYTINDNISLSLDGQNLNNATLKYFSANRDQPRAFYKNGAQYYLTVRVKF